MDVSRDIRRVATSLLFALIVFGSTAAMAGGGVDGQNRSVTANAISANLQLVSQERELRNFVEFNGATLSPVDFDLHQSLGVAEPGFMAHAESAPSSCTATAKISIPGGTGVTLSATAPTCAEALDMIISAIRKYLPKMR